jgi:prepilin-type N-terminal cleavage/methylation domain-containing protein
MNVNLLINFLNSRKNKEQGFTLIELLVVIIIIGILAAIALPSFLNQANKARQSEAQTYVSAINRGQQAYYLEKSEFAPTLDSVGVGIPSVTEYYSYSVKDVTNKSATVDARAIQGLVKPYAGRVFVLEGNEGALTGTILCDGNAGEAPPDISKAETICP